MEKKSRLPGCTPKSPPIQNGEFPWLLPDVYCFDSFDGFSNILGSQRSPPSSWPSSSSSSSSSLESWHFLNKNALPGGSPTHPPFSQRVAGGKLPGPAGAAREATKAWKRMGNLRKSSSWWHVRFPKSWGYPQIQGHSWPWLSIFQPMDPMGLGGSPMTLETPIFLVIPSRTISNMVLLPPPLLLPRSCNPPHRRIGHRRSWRKNGVALWPGLWLKPYYHYKNSYKM